MPVTATKPRRRYRLRERLARSTRLIVDRAAGVIRGVKVLGLTSLNGRRYTLEAIRKAVKLYEGAPVNADHIHKSSEDRSMRDRIGWLENVKVEADGLYADLHLLKSDRDTPKVFEAAERHPSSFGLSHDALGHGDMVEGVLVISEIVEVRSVDLVADPATTRGLSESRKRKLKECGDMAYEEMDDELDPEKKVKEQDDMGLGAPPPPAEEEMDVAADPLLAGFKTKIMEIVDGTDDWQTKKSMIGELLKLQDKAMNMGKETAATTEEEDEDDEDMEESRRRRKHAKSGVSLQERAELLRLRKERKGIELCEAAGIQADKLLRAALAGAENEAEMRAIVKEAQRRYRPAYGRPRSQSPGRTTESDTRVTDAKSFVAAITRRSY